MVGQTVGHYRIVRRIGEGGVGHVYLAQDLRLDRSVALKVLAEASPRPDQIERFEREAKAAAALSHPNILAIHDYGVHASTPYVVMELLDGRNLRQILREGSLRVQTALDYALELVNGLSAAHDKGICHRDLKPENIFVTGDARVKILDFGLATDRDAAALTTPSVDQVTRAALTTPGLVLGTVGYMAPEQIRGERVDGRADIFAFGAVLFEMLTGRRAFDEPTPVETLHSVLKLDAPLHLLSAGGAPVALVEIVRRCLQKSRDERFPSARELATALKSVPAPAEISPKAAARHLDSWKAIASYLGRGVRTVQRWEREEELPVRRLPHAKRGSVYADPHELDAWWQRRGSALTATPPSGSGSPSASAPPSAPTPAPPSESRVERVTDTSAATFWPALSPEGRMLVYVSDAGKDGESPQVWLQQVGGAAMQLTSGLRDCAEPTFSADGTRVIFTATAESTRNVYEMPALGGQPRVLRRAARNARYSPDGRWLAYIPIEPRNALRLVPCAGGDERALTPGLVDIAFATWSEDGRHLLVIAHVNESAELDCWIVPVDGGTPIDSGVMRRARQQGHIVIAVSAAWAGDSLFYCAADRLGVQIWRQRVSLATFETVSAPERMTLGGEYKFFPSVTRRSLSFVATRADVNLWSIAMDSASGTAHGPLRRLTRGAGLVSHLTLSQDGRTLAYFTVSMMGADLRVRNLENGLDTAVPGAANVNRGFPSISPSGQQVAYSAIVTGPPVQRPLFLANLDGGDARAVRDDCGGRPRQWIDEHTLLIETYGSGLNSFLVLDARDGSQRPLLSAATRKVSNPRISPDGGWLAFDAMHPGGSPQVAIAPLGPGTPIEEPAWIVIPESASHPFWSRDGSVLYYLATFPNTDIRSRVVARGFDPSNGRVSNETTEVLTLREMIVPAMVPGTAPIVAPDQIIFVLGDFRGDVWIRDVETAVTVTGDAHA